MRISFYEKHGTSSKISCIFKIERKNAKLDGFIIPLKYLDHTNFYDFSLLDKIKENQITANEILKARHVDLTIRLLDEVLEIKEMFPDCPPHINYSFDNWNKTTMLSCTENEAINRFGKIECGFSSITVNHKLSSEELKLVYGLLCSRRTRFNISYICIHLNSLSECLKVLSMCTSCPELEHIDLYYYTSNVKNKEDVINKAKKKFRRQFGIIKHLEISET